MLFRSDHHSTMYDDAWMPNMQRITWNGVALHGGPLPGYAASHGCVRMPYDFAEKLFDKTRIGMRVIIAPNDVAPVDFSHPALFVPAAQDEGVEGRVGLGLGHAVEIDPAVDAEPPAAHPVVGPAVEPRRRCRVQGGKPVAVAGNGEAGTAPRRTVGHGQAGHLHRQGARRRRGCRRVGQGAAGQGIGVAHRHAPEAVLVGRHGTAAAWRHSVHLVTTSPAARVLRRPRRRSAGCGGAADRARRAGSSARCRRCGTGR